MDRHSSDSKKHSPQSVETSMYLEAYCHAVDLYFERDLQAWGRMLAFQERFVLEAWTHPMPAEGHARRIDLGQACGRRTPVTFEEI
jgi:hypothetical protein